MLLSALVLCIISKVAAGGHFPSWQELTDTTESKPGPPNIHTHTNTHNTRENFTPFLHYHKTVRNHNIIETSKQESNLQITSQLANQ